MIEQILSLFFICFAHAIAQSLPSLPGVQNLQVGYDTVKMLEQSSRYPIFDLTEQSATPFVVKGFDQKRSYAVPEMVQATDVSIRRENSCESVSYTFEQFYSRLVFV